MKIRKYKDIEAWVIPNCHNGEGKLICRSLLDGFESEGFRSMHLDELPAGVSIGLHEHSDNDEEIYFLYSGKAILTYDGEELEMTSGDISLCKRGHSHSIKAIEDCILIVVGDKTRE